MNRIIKKRRKRRINAYGCHVLSYVITAKKSYIKKKISPPTLLKKINVSEIYESLWYFHILVILTVYHNNNMHSQQIKNKYGKLNQNHLTT